MQMQTRWCSSIIYKALKHKAFEKDTQAAVKTVEKKKKITKKIMNNKGEIKLIKVIKAGGSI